MLRLAELALAPPMGLDALFNTSLGAIGRPKRAVSDVGLKPAVLLLIGLSSSLPEFRLPWGAVILLLWNANKLRESIRAMLRLRGPQSISAMLGKTCVRAPSGPMLLPWARRSAIGTRIIAQAGRVRVCGNIVLAMIRRLFAPSICSFECIIALSPKPIRQIADAGQQLAAPPRSTKPLG